MTMRTYIQIGLSTTELGLIPSILSRAFDSIDSIDELVSAVEKSYGFPLHESDGTIIDGAFKYPEDPDLYPIAKYEHTKFPEVTIYQYPYGMVGIIFNKDGEQTQFITRMD